MAAKTYVVRIRRSRSASPAPDLREILQTVPGVRIVNASPQQVQVSCDESCLDALTNAVGDAAIVEEVKDRGYQA
jgi:copper chaperone CopZ